MRKTPYTQIGLARLPCIRCGKPASNQWQICADLRIFRPMCVLCDIDLNDLVMRWIWGDKREEDLRLYRDRKLRQHNVPIED